MSDHKKVKGGSGKRGDSGKKAGENTTKLKTVRNSGRKQTPVTRGQGDPNQENKLYESMTKAFREFPPSCSDACTDLHACHDTHDAEDAEEDVKLEPELLEFEKKHFLDLKKETQAQNRKGTLLHIMVDKWRSDAPWSLKQRRFLNWILQQQDFRPMLEIQNMVGLTPIHDALFNEQDDFVNCVLEAKGLSGINNILKKDSTSTGNCLHIATKCNFPNMKVMIDKCADQSDVLVSRNRSEKDTPLHIAVKELSLPGMAYDLSDPLWVDRGEDFGQGHGIYEEVNILNADFSHDLEENDSEFCPSLENAKGDVSPTYEDFGKDGLETATPRRYKLETDEERKDRLWFTLKNLAKESVRPRPPVALESHNEIRLGHTDALAVSAAVASESIDLPSFHIVRLLVTENPEALEMPNEANRTPYQEREEALLNDSIVKEVISEYARQGSDDSEDGDNANSSSIASLERDPLIVEEREKWAKRMIVVKDPVAHYIRSFCLRNSKSREQTMSRLYQPGKECHIEFDLAGMPNTVIPQAYLDQLAVHLKFESILKYVALPALSIERQPLSNHIDSRISQFGEPISTRGGCSDLVAIFDWLWRNGVREIIKVMVVDDRDRPHADAAIVEALYGFKVEEWDWKRVDLCSDVIYEASPTVREVSLYCSGNSAVLMGWGSAEGLGNRKKFPQLQKVNIYVRDGLEDATVRAWNTDRCKASIEKHSKMGPNEKIIQVEIVPDKNKVSFSSEFYNATDGRDPPWIESIQHFSSFVKAASDQKGNVTPVKIAIIDDGIDATVVGLQSRIVGGATFCPYPHSSDLVNSYFVPSGKHGTLMAQLICRLCPGTQLYIARLEELPASTGGGRRVTARSAAKAVDWAISCGVDIISMSWTIQTTAQDNPDMKTLQVAIDRASTAHILMFCSASDQGGHAPEHCYPGDWNQCLRIGDATFAGDKLTWVDDKVDFWFPGRNVPFPSIDGKTVVYESGSSVATAAATGLAAVLIYSARLVWGDEKQTFQDRDGMQIAFKNMATGSDKKFPRTNEILRKMFEDMWWKEKNRLAPETQRGNRTMSIDTLPWDKVSQRALESLVQHIQKGY